MFVELITNAQSTYKEFPEQCEVGMVEDHMKIRDTR